MALSDLTFKLYTDSSLTTPYSGTTSDTFATDGSDSPKDYHLYFGSTDDTRQLQATSNPGVDQITLTPTDALDDWVANTAYSLNDVVEPTTPNGYIYRCTTAGTSHAATEPTWPTSGVGSTVSDGTVTWTFLGARHLLTEIKLATTEGGLAGASAGAALNLGHTITGGTANYVDVWMRITNAVTQVRDNAGYPEQTININEVIETEV